MAEGGEVPGRRDDLRFNCLPCQVSGIEESARRYCFKCEEFFCHVCAEQHKRVFSVHQLTETESRKLPAALALQAEFCLQHGKVTNFYCQRDAAIGCEICVALEHATCSEVVYLPVSAQRLIEDIDINEVKCTLRQTIERLESINVNQQASVTHLEEDKEKCLQQIDDLHTDLQCHVKRIIESSKDKIHASFERFSSDLQHQSRKIQKKLSELDETEKRMHCSTGNVIKCFLEVTKCKQELVSTEDVYNQYLDGLKVQGFTVAVDGRLQCLLTELETLVNVLERAPVRVSNKYRLDISTTEDKNKCRVHGSCILTDGTVVLADWNNKTLKRVCPFSHRVIDRFTLSHTPEDVCFVEGNVIAVALYNRTVVFVSVKPQLAQTRTIITNHRCAYISCSQNKLFVNDIEKSIYIYNLDGQLQRTVSTVSPDGEHLSVTRHITVDEAEGTVIVADENKGLLIMDMQGQLLDTLLPGSIHGITGLCLDGAGGRFVCGYKSGNIVHVGSDGRLLAEVLTKSDGLAKPLSLCYDKIHKRLCVSQEDRKHLFVCEIE